MVVHSKNYGQIFYFSLFDMSTQEGEVSFFSFHEHYIMLFKFDIRLLKHIIGYGKCMVEIKAKYSLLY